MAAPADERLRRAQAQVHLKGRAAACAVLALLPLTLFPRAFLRGEVFYFRDVHLQWVGQVESLVRVVAAGSWPVWNPYVSFGQPLLANPNYEVYYPPTLLNLVMRPWSYYRLFVFGHLVLGGAGAYAAARALGLSAPASLLAGSMWLSSGPLVSLVSLWNHLAGAAWLPWSAWAGARAVAEARPGATVAWGAILAAPVLAGSPEMALFAAALGAAFALGAARSAGTLRRAWPPILGAATVALALSAAQWVPSVELALRSGRAALPTAQREFWSVPPPLLLQSVWPVRLDVLPLRDDVRAVLFESREPFLVSLYVGAPSVILVAFAALARSRAAAALLLGALLLVLVSLGRHTPVAPLLETVVPAFRSLRFPAKALVPASLLWALAAAAGLDLWRRPDGARRSRAARVAAASIAAVAALLAAVLWADADAIGDVLLERGYTRRAFAEVLAPARHHAAASAALTVLVAVFAWVRSRGGRGSALAAAAVPAAAVLDLVLANGSSTPTAPVELLTARPPAAAYLAPPPRGRVYVFDYFEAGEAERHLGHRGYLLKVPRDEWPAPWVEAAALRAALHPPVLPQWGLEDAFRLDALGLYTPEMTALTLALRRTQGSPAHLRLLQMGGVTHVAALHEAGLSSLVPVARLPTLFLEDLHLFTVPGALPRVHVAAGARVPPAAEALKVMLSAGFDPRREVVLSEGHAREVPLRPPGGARLVEWRPDRVTVEAELTAAGHVVLLDAYDPAWRATVNGRPAAIARANLGFRAVEAPEGRSRIVFTYRPPAALIGLAISALAALSLLAAIAGRAWSRTSGAVRA